MSRGSTKERGHSTKDELVYIQKIGSYLSYYVKPSRTEMLKSYLTALEQRANWGAVDKDIIVKAVNDELLLCETA